MFSRKLRRRGCAYVLPPVADCGTGHIEAYLPNLVCPSTAATVLRGGESLPTASAEAA